MTTSPLVAFEVPSIAWSPEGPDMGPCACKPLHLSGSPSVPLPPEFLSEIEPDLASRRVPAAGRPELRQAIGTHLERTSGVRLDPEREVIVTNGAIQALDLVFRALVSPGAAVGMVCPTFFADRLLPEGVHLIRFDTRPEDSWHPTDALFERIRGSDLDVLFLVNPNNPTGVVYTERELMEIVRATEHSGTLLIVDEAYEAFVFDGNRHRSLHGIADAGDRVVTIQSFTKSFGLGAARLGFVFGSSRWIDPVRRMLDWVTLASNPLSQALALAALKSADSWQALLRSEFEVNRRSLTELVGVGLPMGTMIPEGATFSMLDISGLGVDSRDGARRLWHSTGIACVPGSEFPGDVHTTDAYLRLPLGAPAAIFEDALVRLADFFRLGPRSPGRHDAA